jgi:hypothetical protein
MDENKKKQFAEMQKEMFAFQNSYVQSFASANGDILGSLQVGLKRQEEDYYEESISGTKNSLEDLLMQPEYNTGNQMPYPF